VHGGGIVGFHDRLDVEGGHAGAGQLVAQLKQRGANRFLAPAAAPPVFRYGQFDVVGGNPVDQGHARAKIHHRGDLATLNDDVAKHRAGIVVARAGAQEWMRGGGAQVEAA